MTQHNRTGTSAARDSVSGCARVHIGVLLLCALCTGARASENIIRVDPAVHGPDSIRVEAMTAERVHIAFTSARGIYAFDLQPLPPTLTTLVFELCQQRMLESLSIRLSSGQYVALFDAKTPSVEGLSVARHTDGWLATFSGDALETLRPGGRIQVIDAYR